MEQMPQAPFFSIIIPTYNRADFLRIAIKSIQDQKFTDFELIIVDDGSTDQTKDAVGNLIKTDSRLKYFYKENEERSIARNFGIFHSKGRYVSFLDSDDRLYSNHLEVAFELLNREGLPEVGHVGYQLVEESGRTISVRNDFDEAFKDKLLVENIAHGNAIFIRRDIAQQVNFVPSKYATISEDWYLWLRLAARYKFVFDNKVTSNVIEHDQRSLNNINPDSLIASTEVIVQHLKADAQFESAYGRRVARHYADHFTLVSLILSLTPGRKMDTVKFLLKALRHSPSVVAQRRFMASVKHLIIGFFKPRTIKRNTSPLRVM